MSPLGREKYACLWVEFCVNKIWRIDKNLAYFFSFCENVIVNFSFRSSLFVYKENENKKYYHHEIQSFRIISVSRSRWKYKLKIIFFLHVFVYSYLVWIFEFVSIMFHSKFLSYSSHGKHILYSNDVNGSLNGRFVVKLILWSLPRLNFWSNSYRYKRHLVFQDVHILKLKSLQGHNAYIYVLSRYEIFLTSLRDIIITFLHKFSNVTPNYVLSCIYM